MHAQVHDSRNATCDANGFCHQRLSAMSGGLNPSRRVHGRPEVVAAPFFRLADVQPDPCPQHGPRPRRGGQPACASSAALTAAEARSMPRRRNRRRC